MSLTATASHFGEACAQHFAPPVSGLRAVAAAMEHHHATHHRAQLRICRRKARAYRRLGMPAHRLLAIGAALHHRECHRQLGRSA